MAAIVLPAPCLPPTCTVMTSTLKSTGTKMAAKGSKRTPRSCASTSSRWHAWRDTAERLHSHAGMLRVEELPHWLCGDCTAHGAVLGVACTDSTDLLRSMRTPALAGACRVSCWSSSGPPPVIELRRQRVPQPPEQVHEAVEVLCPAQHQCLQPLQRYDALLPVHCRTQASAHLRQV